MNITIYSKDEKLKKAVLLFLEGENLPYSGLILTDLDDFPRKNLKGELTFSYENKEADLLRPFSFKELLCKIKELFEKEDSFLKLYLEKDTFYLQGKNLDLTPTEFRLLKLLYDKKGEVLTKEEAENALFHGEKNSNQLNVYIRYLRKKTFLEGQRDLISTSHGKGFYINV